MRKYTPHQMCVKNQGIASGVEGKIENGVKRRIDLKRENCLIAKKALWRERLAKWFVARVTKKKGNKNIMRYWYNTKDKFNRLLTEVAREHSIELQKWPPEDVLLIPELWSYLFMEVDRWANDTFFDFEHCMIVEGTGELLEVIN